MRIGVMGVHYGHIGGMLGSALAAPGGEIVGMVEPDDDLYEAQGGQRDMPRYPSLEDMLSDARPELILEGVVHRDKTELVEACAAAGCHLLLDKPLCYGLEDWERIRTAVQDSGIRLSMWFTSRSHPPFIALRQGQRPDLIRIGWVVGEVVSVELEEIIPVAPAIHRVSPVVPGFAPHARHVFRKCVLVRP